MSEKKEQKKLAWKDIGINKLLLLLAAGVALVILSLVKLPELPAADMETASNVKEQSESELSITKAAYEEVLEERLKSVLALADGVGKVEVMITIKASGEKIALTEQPYTNKTSSEKDSQGGSRDSLEVTQSETVIYIKNSDGSAVPYIVKETAPQIEGVVVIAQGAGDIRVVSNIIDAVMALFDVPNHKIKVLEMKTSS